MNEDVTLINRVAGTELVTIALDDFMSEETISAFDIKDYLFHGLILKEKDFREALKIHDWSQYKNKMLAVYCSADAIIPMWAYMLISSLATPEAKNIFFGSIAQLKENQLLVKISANDWEYLRNKRVVVKGCSDVEIPASAYLAITNKLQPIAQSIMYGEPCSTVPIFKRPRIL